MLGFSTIWNAWTSSISLVRSNLEYNKSIWTPHQLNQILNTEKVQKSYNRQLAYRFHINYNSYSDRLSTFNLLSVYSRRTYSDMCLHPKILHTGDMNLHNEVRLRVNRRKNTRNTTFFGDDSKTDFGFYKCPTTRLQWNYTQNFGTIEIQSSTFHTF